MKESLEKIAKLDTRYSSNALKFVHQGLGATVDSLYESGYDESESHHITGRQLCFGLAQLATKNWGRLAKVVLNYGGIKTTRDFGEIVYLLIEHNWMHAQPPDSITDFYDIYDFENVFEKKFKFDKLKQK